MPFVPLQVSPGVTRLAVPRVRRAGAADRATVLGAHGSFINT